MGVKARLLLYIAVPLVAAMFFSAYATYFSNSSATRSVLEKDIKTTAFFMAENVNLIISNMQHSLSIVAKARYAAGFDGGDTAVHELFFREIKAAMPYVEDVFLLNSQGDVLVSLDKGDYGKNYAARPYFQKSIQGEPAVVGPLISLGTGNACVFVSVPLGGGAWQGVLVTSVEVKSIVEMCLQSEMAARDVNIFLLDKSAALISAMNKKVDRPGFYQELGESVQSRVSGPAGFILYPDATGQGTSTGFVARVKKLDWLVVAGMSDADIDKSAVSSSRDSLFLGLLAIGIGLLISFLMIYRMMDALYRIVGYAKNISSGDLSANLAVDRRDELGQLAASLQVMVETLRGDQERLNALVQESTSQWVASREKLRVESSLLKTVLNSVPDLVFYKDMNGVYRGCNKSFCKFVGRDEEYIVGKNDMELFNITENEASKFIDDDNKVFRGELETLVREEEVVYPNGEKIFLETIKRLYHSEDHVPFGMVGIARNIQLRKETEKAHAKAMQEAHEASMAKSDFVARISHEIRTPLNAIIGINYLLQQICTTLEQQKYLYKMDLAAKNLLSIINDVLDFSKIEAGKLELEKYAFSLPDLVHNLISVNEAMARTAHLTLVARIDPRIPQRLVGDSMRINQVLLNFVSNAAKFSKQGSVVIGVEMEDEDACGVMLRFSVADEGIGISQEQLSKLFTPFTQADGSMTRQYGGTGLGLSICKMLVEAMGGSVGATSAEGQGSVFFFRLRLARDEDGQEQVFSATKPTALSPAGQSQSAEGHSGDRSLKDKRVLLVEDNAINQEIAVEILSLLGLAVDVAGNGREAVDMVRTKDYGLVLMDIQMPVMDGYEATRLIREDARCQNLPIIAMTANAMDVDRAVCLAAGMNAHMGKPFDPQQLKRLLEKWCL